MYMYIYVCIYMLFSLPVGGRHLTMFTLFTNIISVKIFFKNPHSLKSHRQSETNILQYPKIFCFLVIIPGLTGNRSQPCIIDPQDRTIDLNQLNLWASIKMLRLILKIFSLQKQERKKIDCLFGHFYILRKPCNYNAGNNEDN